MTNAIAEQTGTDAAKIAGLPAYIDAITAAKLIGRDRQIVARLAKQGKIATHKPEGLRQTYRLADVVKYMPPAA